MCDQGVCNVAVQVWDDQFCERWEVWQEDWEERVGSFGQIQMESFQFERFLLSRFEQDGLYIEPGGGVHFAVGLGDVALLSIFRMKYLPTTVLPFHLKVLEARKAPEQPEELVVFDGPLNNQSTKVGPSRLVLLLLLSSLLLLLLCDCPEFH